MDVAVNLNEDAMVKMILDVAGAKVCLHIVLRHCWNFKCLGVGF